MASNSTEKRTLSSEDKELIDALRKEPIMIYEDVQGSKFFANWDGKRWSFKAKSINNHPLTQFDLVVQRYWTGAVNYMMSQKPEITGLLNPDWWFCFEYFPDSEPAHVLYDETPTNNLVLTWIVKQNGNLWSQHVPELYEYSKLFDCDILPVIFYNKLSDKQVDAIQTFLETSAEDLEYIFGEDNFATFFYKILAPQRPSSYLMKPDTYNDNLEKLMVRFVGDSQKWKSISLELLNPLYKRVSQDSSTDYMQVYSLILLSFMESVNLMDLDQIEIEGETDFECYIDLMSELYKRHIKRTTNNPEDWNFRLPKFYFKEKHQLNMDQIEDDELLDLLGESMQRQYVFKTVLNAFTKKLKKPLGLFKDSTVKEFNRIRDEIHDKITEKLGIEKFDIRKVSKLNIPTFDKMGDHAKAADGQIYIDIERERDDDLDPDPSQKKKKDKGLFGKLGKDNVF